jgi:KipI family sensor histidine kinase inhibitor
LTAAGSIRIFDVAEGAVLVEYPELSEPEANRKAVATSRRLTGRPPAGFLDAVVGARTLSVEFDPARGSRGRFAQEVSAGASGADADAGHGRLLRVPVFYDANSVFGPDLQELSSQAGLSADEFARRHARGSYRVAFVGFAPGFAYLTGLAPELHAPRLATPRTRVPAGSVGIGGPYTGIYPGRTPGGWRLIGRAPVRLFDPLRDPPALLLPGDGVEFEPIGREEFERRRGVLEPEVRAAIPGSSGSPLFRVVAAGVLTTVQGRPRHGWERYGVPPGGAMDPASLASANALLGNSALAPGLEMTLVGPELEVLREEVLALSAGAAQATLNGRPLPAGSVFSVRPGDQIAVGPLSDFSRAYLCAAGGLAQPQRPGDSRRLAGGDSVLAAPRPGGPGEGRSPGTGAAIGRHEIIVRVLAGPQRERFGPEGLATFLSRDYRVSASSDRRGIRLEGPPISNRESPDIPPEGTTLGGIQVPRDGQPIVLGPDRPVTGGYARIATVIAADFPVLARALPGTALRFSEVTLAEALAASSSESRGPSPDQQG